MGVREFKGKLKKSGARAFAGKVRKLSDEERNALVERMQIDAGVPGAAGQTVEPLAGTFTPTPQPSQETIGGREGEAGFFEKLVTPGIEAPFDVSDLTTLFGASAGTLATGGTSIPISAALQTGKGFLPGLARFGAKEIPRALGAGAGAGTGGGIEEALENEDAGLLDILSSAGQTGLEFGASELAGAGILKGGKLATTKMRDVLFPGFLSESAEQATKFAKERGAPIAAEEVKKGSRFIQRTINQMTIPQFLRAQKATVIDEFIDKETKRLKLDTGDVGATAENTTRFIQGLFKEGSDEFDNFMKIESGGIGEKTPISINSVIKSADDALRLLVKSGEGGKTFAKKIRALKTGETSPFGIVDDLRKLASKMQRGKGSGNFQAGEIIEEAIKDDYRLASRLAGVDLVAQVEKANNNWKILSGSGLGAFKEFKNAKGYIKSLVRPGNEVQLAHLKQQSPEIYDQLLESKLTLMIEQSKQKKDWIADFGKEISKNEEFLKTAYGPEKFDAIENFVNYLGFTERLRGSKFDLNQIVALGKASAELGAIQQTSGGSLVFQIPANIIAAGLNNPNSKLFKLFTANSPQALNTILSRTAGTAREILPKAIAEVSQERRQSEQ